VDHTVVGAGKVSLALALDLDNIGSEIGEVARSQGGRNGLLEGDDANTGEGE
jgi:hypothetical protein